MRRRDWLTVAIAGTALASAVFLVGGALRWVQAVVAGLLAIALVFELRSRRGFDRLSPLLALIGVATGLTAIQLIPLPYSVLHAIDAPGTELTAFGAGLVDTHPWMCLSLDPPGTLRALAFFITLYGVAVLTMRIASSERGKYMVIAGVALVCGLAAAVTGIHILCNLGDLYGIYEPQHADPPILGPLLNANHLGCLMAFGTVLSIGLMFYERQASELRVLWTVNAIGCALVTFGSESRGAAIGLVIGAIATVGILIGRRISSGRRSSSEAKQGLMRDLPIALVAAIGLAIAVYTSAGKVADQLENTTLSELNHPLSKFEAWKASMHLVSESPWIGVGRGAIEPTLTRVHDASAYVTFSHLENEYVSAIVEWGIPGAFILALALGWCMITAMRRWRDGPLVAGALGALAAVMFQSSVDFGIELIGVAVPVTAVAATVLGVPLRQRSSPHAHRMRTGGLAAALLGAAVVLLLPATRTLQEDHDDIEADADVSMDELRADIQRHPLDYFAFGRASELMLKKEDPRGVQLLNHALTLHPTHPGLHRIAARMLFASLRPKQAALEYRLAMNGTLAPKNLLTEIVGMLGKGPEAAEAIPTDSEAPVSILRTLDELDRNDIAIQWLELVIKRQDADTQTIDTLYSLALSRPDLDAAKQAAARRLEIAHTYVSRVMLARVEFMQKDYAPVMADLADVAQWHSRIDVQGDAWLIRCDILIEQGELDQASECVHRLDGSGLLNERRGEIEKRLQTLEAKRASVLTAHAIQNADHLAAPPQVDLSRPPMTNPPSPAITNPLQQQPQMPSLRTPTPAPSRRRN